MFFMGSFVLVMMVFGKDLTDERAAFYFRPILPFIYFCAGFHKLNADFFDPTVSCANEFLHRVLNPELIRTLSQSAIAVIVPAAAVVWELSAMIFLHMRRTQIGFIVVSAVLHGVLSLYHFADFGSLMLALFFLWIPPATRKPFASTSAKTAFASMALAAFVLPTKVFSFLGTDVAFLLVGVCLLVAFAIVGVQSISFKPIESTCAGVRVWCSPKQLILPLLLIAFSASPYFGLRTSGNLTMFSNLKTEGQVSNHWLLPSNPLKMFSLQEDQVKFVQIDPKHGTERRVWLKDFALPATELYKKAQSWNDQGISVAATYWYRGELLQTDDLAADQRWQTDKYLQVHAKWLDFRMIQSEGPNQCRW